MAPAVKASKAFGPESLLITASPAFKRKPSRSRSLTIAPGEEGAASLTTVSRWPDGVGYDVFESPTGPITVIGSPGGLHEIFLSSGPESGGARRTPAVVDSLRHAPHDPIISQAREQLLEYFRSERRAFTLPLAPLTGTAFQRAAWAALARIPYGRVTSYGEQARDMGLAVAAARAVGAANGRNPLPIIVPCHRVVGKTGALTGFASGLHHKEALLKLEASVAGRFPRAGLPWKSLSMSEEVGRDRDTTCGVACVP